jgi:hypothetical protein
MKEGPNELTSLKPKICPAHDRTSSTLSDSKIGSKAFPEKILQEEAYGYA